MFQKYILFNLLFCFAFSVQAISQDAEAKFAYYKERSIYYQNFDIDSSRIYIDSCLLTASQLDEQYFMGLSYELKSRDFYMRSLIDSALFYEKKACEVFQYYPDSSAHYSAEYNLGNIYLDRDEHIQALVQFKKVLRIIDENFDIG